LQGRPVWFVGPGGLMTWGSLKKKKNSAGKGEKTLVLGGGQRNSGLGVCIEGDEHSTGKTGQERAQQKKSKGRGGGQRTGGDCHFD